MDYSKNFGFTHKSGILMHVSSLPCDYGIGTFGKPCLKWIDFLHETKTKCWQVLPLNPTAYADSPYQCPSSFAGNPYFIDLDDLYAKKLLTKAELHNAKNNSQKIDFGWLFETRFEILRKAYSRFSADQQYNSFCEEHSFWLEDYAFYMALKVHYSFKAWIEWSDEHKFYNKAQKCKQEFVEEIGFWKFLQFLFFQQWEKVMDYAHQKGIMIVGDMPIYVAYDSVEVWSNPSDYVLDEKLYPKVVAGCPPDGFALDGQLWGNPIYDWKKMQKNNFRWWVERVKQCFRMYDILRIDHFRGFAGYYVIEFGQKTARIGHWEKGVGKKLFTEINKQLPNAKIIAEDLGFITPDVQELLDYCGYPGMKILQFAFYDDESDTLPRNYKNENCVVYTGSHDADCTFSWCENLSGDTLKRFKRECPETHAGNPTYSLIDFAFSSKSNLAIIPLQDWLLLDNEQGRMNTPSVAEGNWRWRAPKNYANAKLKKKIIQLTQKNNRSM